jgi:uncharacterized membrane protein YtjA (UPF0391 family)
MLRLAVVFLVIALGAAFLGFAGVRDFSFDGARVLFVVFLLLAALFVAKSRIDRRSVWG